MQVIITDATKLNSKVQKGDSRVRKFLPQVGFCQSTKIRRLLNGCVIPVKDPFDYRVTLLGFRRMCGYRRAVMYWLSYVVRLYSLNDGPKPMELKLKVNKPRFQYCI